MPVLREATCCPQPHTAIIAAEAEHVPNQTALSKPLEHNCSSFPQRAVCA